MDTVIKPRPATGAKQRRGRPKSIHRDSMDSPKTPVRAATGTLKNRNLNTGQARSSVQSVECHLICLFETAYMAFLKIYLYVYLCHTSHKVHTQWTVTSVCC